jgi:hypothetical protein
MRAPRPSDTRCRGASTARHHNQTHGDPTKPNRSSANGATIPHVPGPAIAKNSSRVDSSLNSVRNGG